MAAVEEVRNKPSLQNRDSLEVITLSSDEEEIEETADDVNYLFDRFILACRPHLQNEALIDARKKFKEAPRDFVCSKEITSMLKRYTEHVNKDNAVVYMESVGTRLADGNEKKQRYVPNHNNIEESRRNGNGNSDVTKARDFEEVKSEDRGENQTTANLAVDNSSKIEGNVSDDEVDFVCEVKRKSPEAIPSTSTQSSQPQGSDEVKLPKSGKLSTKDFSIKQQRKLVSRLKTRLKEISQEIKILNKSELTLDEMEMADSNYIKENRLKKRFDKTWNKLCKILGRPPNTGRVVEKKVRASNTGYSIIDKAIEKFLDDKRGKFPDYYDVRDLVFKANKTHDLRMAPQVLNGLIADIFTDIGNKLQKLREKDLIFNFGSHLLDDFKTDEDPALASEDLCKQLERNRKISKKKLKQVYEKYTHLERHGKSGKKGTVPSTSEDMVAKEVNGLNVNSEGTTTDDDDQELTKSGNFGFTSEEESIDSSQPCSSKTILRNGDPIDYERHSISDEELAESTQPCSSRTLLSLRSPETTIIETKCPSECVASRTIECAMSVLDKDSNVSLSCSSGTVVNNTDQNIKMVNSVDNATSITIDNCQIVIDSQDEEAVPSSQGSDAPVPNSACTVPIGTDEHKLPNIDNSTSVVNDGCQNDDCQNDDCQIIVDSPAKKAGVSNTSQTCDTLLSSALSVPTLTNKQKSNIDNPKDVLNDDCQIIIDSPDEEACSSTTNHNTPKSPNSPTCSFPVVTNIEQKPNIATTNTVTNSVENSKFSANNYCHIIIDSTDESALEEVNRTNARKRKASNELTCDSRLIEKVSSAIRNKRLKLPCRNSTEITLKSPTREPLKDKAIFNGMNSSPSVNGKVLVQIPSQHREAFREKTLNALKNKQQDTTDSSIGTSGVSSTAFESPRQETPNRMNSTNTIRTNCEKEECEVIIIDD